MTFWRSFSTAYRLFALMVLNTVVFFVLLNGMLWVAFRVKDSHVSRRLNDPVTVLDGKPELRQVYPDMEPEAIHRLLVETWKRSFVYDPFTQFKERPFRGHYVNVTTHGYRRSRDQGPWPPSPEYFNVFVFGGSTTFGYGVADDQTVASFIQQELAARMGKDVRAYNFGRGSYTSSQERVLFERLLVSGVRPDVAIFVDGLNEFAFPHGPAHAMHLEKAFDARGRLSVTEVMSRLPMTRLARYAHRKVATLVGARPRTAGADARDRDSYDDPALIDAVIHTYLENQRLIEAVADNHGVDVAFVWQPIPLYKYDLRYHLFGDSEFGTNHYAPYGYKRMAELRTHTDLGDNFLWCADIQEGLEEPLYVDHVHYTGRMSARIAQTIATKLIDRGLIPASR